MARARPVFPSWGHVNDTVVLNQVNKILKHTGIHHTSILTHSARLIMNTGGIIYTYIFNWCMTN